MLSTAYSRGSRWQGNSERRVRACNRFRRDALGPHDPSGTIFSDFQFFGSLKPVWHVRFAPNSDQNVAVPRKTLSANFGLMHRSKVRKIIVAILSCTTRQGGYPNGSCYDMPMSIGFSTAPPLSAQSLKAPILYTWP
jgi:hypothetical protein